MATLYAKFSNLNQKSQSSLEYVALITLMAAVIFTVIYSPNHPGHKTPFRNSLESAFTSVGDAMVREIGTVTK
jgi:Flp pilus assembly pilin Flp